ncbi:unnamed protein product [Strongylus vulgaris]|uniref:CN hydrolase domain-containing protein n=1 Tax=Strongylus vulgaris TaxID=40348 RepID=A0A3P7L6N0_STRVU|nr:unnamed protein product [Strongylus vulgaris]
MGSPFNLDSVDEALKEALQSPVYEEVHRILYGEPHPEIEVPKEALTIAEKNSFDLKCYKIAAEPEQEIEVPKEALTIAEKNNFELKCYKIAAEPEQLRAPRKVRVAAIQFSCALPASAPIEEQRAANHQKAATMIEAAAAAGANVVCMHEFWAMPYVFCTRERLPWTEFAESAEDGPTTKFMCQLAVKHNLVIVSSILERDDSKDEVLWNTAVVISNSGAIIGKSRKNHIPRIGDFQESTYFMESTLGHPVFETAFGVFNLLFLLLRSRTFDDYLNKEHLVCFE